MADQKISQLNNITGADVADGADVLAIVDSSANETKKITRAELFSGVANFSLDGSIFSSADTNNVAIFGGTNGDGARMVLHGSASTSPGVAVVDSDDIRLRPEDISTNWLRLTASLADLNLPLNVAGDASITGLTSVTSLALNGAVQWGQKVIIADDAVATITPPFKGGWMAFSVNSSSDFPLGNIAIFGHIDIGSSPDFKQVYKGSLIDILTNDQDLNTTPGTDGRVTVSLRSNGTMQINNRFGSTRTVDIHLNGAT